MAVYFVIVSEEAIGFARTNADRQKERDAREDELVSLKGLEETHETAVQDISEDEKDLTTIMKKCSSDILSIGISLAVLICVHIFFCLQTHP